MEIVKPLRGHYCSLGDKAIMMSMAQTSNNEDGNRR